MHASVLLNYIYLSKYFLEGGGAADEEVDDDDDEPIGPLVVA